MRTMLTLALLLTMLIRVNANQNTSSLIIKSSVPIVVEMENQTASAPKLLHQFQQLQEGKHYVKIYQVYSAYKSGSKSFSKLLFSGDLQAKANHETIYALQDGRLMLVSSKQRVNKIKENERHHPHYSNGYGNAYPHYGYGNYYSGYHGNGNHYPHHQSPAVCVCNHYGQCHTSSACNCNVCPSPQQPNCGSGYNGYGNYYGNGCSSDYGYYQPNCGSTPNYGYNPHFPQSYGYNNYQQYHFNSYGWHNFFQFKNSFERLYSDREKMSFLQQYFPKQKVSVAQVTALVESFAFEKNKLEAVELFLPYIQDKQNFYQLDRQFEFSSNKRALARMMQQ